MKTEQKDKPLVIFPKRRQHSGRTFQFSINTKKFQRVLEANPLEVLQFSKSNNTQERDKRKTSNNTISQMQTQKGRQMGNYRNHGSRRSRSLMNIRNKSREGGFRNCSSNHDLTFAEADEDEYIRNKRRASVNASNLSIASSNEQKRTNKRPTETSI